MKLDWFTNMPSADAELERKHNRMLRRQAELRDREEQRLYKLKYEADGLKNCKDNATLMGEKDVKLQAEM